MAGLMVYLPGYAGSDRNELVERGCESLLEPDIDVLFHQMDKGPDGGRGALVSFYAPRLVRTPCSFDAATQTWREAPPDGKLPGGRYWLGYVNDAKPTAGDLQRAELIDGEPVKLLDDNYWVIPIAQYTPKRLTRDPRSGNEVAVPLDKHKLFVDSANALYRYFLSEAFQVVVSKDYVIRVPDGLYFASLALSKNYRLNADAIDLLGLVGEYEAFDIARVATGMAILERKIAEKKIPGYLRN